MITKFTSGVRVLEPLALLGGSYLAYVTAELFHWYLVWFAVAAVVVVVVVGVVGVVGSGGFGYALILALLGISLR